MVTTGGELGICSAALNISLLATFTLQVADLLAFSWYLRRVVERFYAGSMMFAVMRHL